MLPLSPVFVFTLLICVLMGDYSLTPMYVRTALQWTFVTNILTIILLFGVSIGCLFSGKTKAVPIAGMYFWIMILGIIETIAIKIYLTAIPVGVQSWSEYNVNACIVATFVYCLAAKWVDESAKKIKQLEKENQD